MKNVVSIVRCPGYEPEALDRALAEAQELAPLPELRGASVLVKPNILIAADPGSAVTTHPEFLRAFIRLLRAKGASRVAAGDSPSWQSQDLAGRRSGLKEAAESEGAAWADFSEGAERECPNGRRVRRFTLASALAGHDLLVSLPKLKTHGLMLYTGAIKNLFGLVPGLGKSAFHLRFPDPADFGSMLVDLALAARPAYSMMDAVVAMEGRGPSNGRPVELGLVLGSRDPAALDWTAASLIGYDPSAIGYLAEAAARAAADPSIPWIGSAADISVLGLRLDDARPVSFELVRQGRKDADFLTSRLPPRWRELARNMSARRPFFDHRACLRCGACARICPAGALVVRERVEIDRSKCIRCYCCDEVCPAAAIKLLRRPW